MAEAQVLLEKLLNANGSINIPGLSFDSISDNFIKKTIEQYSDVDINMLSKQDLDEYKESLKEQYKPIITENIAIIKTNYKSAKTNLNTIQDMLKTFVGSIAIPTTISVPPASSNPAWTMLDVIQKITSLKAILLVVETALIMLLIAADKIKFDIPDSITQIISLYSIVSQGINKIPVG